MSTEIRTVYGADLLPYLEDLAVLRIIVFREYPYLYDGDLAYERTYLQNYATCPQCVTGLVFDGSKIVGATTAMPLSAADPEFSCPFRINSLPVDSYFYFGESVLLSEYRGMGYGSRFFDLREQTARSFDFKSACFCVVDRPDDHPDKPTSYRPLDRFWHRRGFQKTDYLQCDFSWKELGQDKESSQTLTFWTKDL